MEDVLNGLSMHLKIVTTETNDNPVLIFSIACAIIGALAIALDFTIG